MLNSVLIVMDQLPLAGKERCTINLADKLAGDGIRITLVTGNGPYIKFLPKTIKAYFAPIGSNPNKVIAEKIILKAALTNRSQIIHAQCRYSLILSQLTRKSLGIPAIFTEHSEYEFPANSLELNTYADTIITVTSKIADGLIRHGIPPGKITTIFNGVDVRDFSLPGEKQRRAARKKLNVSPDDRVILSLSRVVPGKKIEKIIEAFPAVLTKVPKAKLLIVGDDEWNKTKPEIVKRIKTLGLENHILVFPATHNVRLYYAAADIFCHPSRGKGMSVMEAMASGLPLVAKAPVSEPLVAQDQTTGLLLYTDDTKELANKLIFLLENPALSDEMGRVGRKRVENMFRLETCVEQTKQAYVKTIQQLAQLPKDHLLFLQKPQLLE